MADNTTSATEDDFGWLMSTVAEPLLDETLQQFVDKVNVVRIAKRLRKQTTPSRAAIIMEQAQLRIRGRGKFSLADQMFFTRKGLEQSTGQSIAKYKASRFDGIDDVVDLCCGIGGDLVGLAGRRGAKQTLGVDVDNLSCRFANHHLKLYYPDAKVDSRAITGDVERFDWGGWEGVHCDPDRRLKDRTVVGNRFSPPLLSLFSGIQSDQNVAMKVAPATSADEYWPTEIEREWIGDRRECKQQVLWLGPKFNRPGQRTATMVDGDHVVQLSVYERDLDVTIKISKKIGRYLYEPHPTVLAAGMTNILANRGGLTRIDPEIDYLTSCQPMKSPLITRFEVVESFPLNSRRTLEVLRRYEIGEIEVKNRGATQVHYQQFQRLSVKGIYRATIILTRIGLQQYVAICRRNPTDFPI